jgi:nicotinamide riboside kinase
MAPLSPVAAQRICLMGAECTGKTTLARALAQHFSGLWVPEYLRAFCDAQGRTPSLAEQRQIMCTQFEQEELVLAQATQAGCSYVFCDTTPLLTAIYSDFYFADTSLFESAHALHDRYALSLVLQPDLPWQPDGLQRDGEATRQAIHTRVLHELQARRYPHVEVSGVAADRLQAAILAVEILSA